MKKILFFVVAILFVVTTQAQDIASADTLSQKKVDIGIYPIPNDGLFTVTISNLSETTATILVYNSLGKKMYEEKESVKSGAIDKKIDLRPVPNGLYILVCEGQTKKIFIN